MLCKYKDFFGQPGQGAHSLRIGNFAIVDIIGTLLVALFLSKKFNWNFYFVLIITFLIGIIAHRIFCVKTQLDTLLFSN